MALANWDANPILPNLILGDFDAAEDRAAIQYFNIRARLTILNCSEKKCVDQSIIAETNQIWEWIELDDTFLTAEDMQKYLITAADFIHNKLNDGHVVIVHCWSGVSRSSTMIIAYLIKYKKMSFADAMQHVADCRPKISPNGSFKVALRMFEENGGILPKENATEIDERDNESCYCALP